MRKTYSLKDATIKLVDGTGTPVKIEIMMDDGTLTVNTARNVEYKMNRGKLDDNTDIREGDDVPMEVSITGRMDGFLAAASGNANLTPFEFLAGGGTLVSTGDACQPFACDIEITMAHPNGCDPGHDPELIILPEFRYETRNIDFKAGTLQVSGKCKATEPEVTRPA